MIISVVNSDVLLLWQNSECNGTFGTTLGFWNRLILRKFTKFSYILYQALRTPENITSKWIINVRKILSDIGRHDLWLHQSTIHTNSIRFLVFNTFKDHFLQAWRSELADDDSSSKAKNYSYIKDNIELNHILKSCLNTCT